MADSLGRLVVELSASTATFTDAISKAAYQLDHGMAQMARSTRQLETALLKLDAAAGTFGVSLRSLFGIVAVGGMGALVKGAIDSQAELGRLAERASTTVEDLNSMRVAAHEGGVSLEDVAISMNRLSKAVFEGQDGTTKAAQALGLLGLKAADLVKMPTAQAMQTVAVALNQFRDSAGKSAVEMELLAKSGTKAGAFLKALAEDGPAAVSVTTQMATAAREAEARFFALSDSFSTLQTAAANKLLPAVDAILSAFVELQKSNEQTLGFWTILGEGLRLLAGGLAQVYLLVKITIIDLAAYAAIANDIAHLRFGAARDEWAALKKSINEAEEAQGRFYTALMKGSPFFGPPAANAGRSAMYVGDPYYHGSSPGGGRNIGNLPSRGGAGAGTGDEMAGWDNLLKGQRDAYNKMQVLQGSYDLWSINQTRDYWEEVLVITDLSSKMRLAAENKYFDAQAQVLQKEGELRARLGAIAAKRDEDTATFAAAMGRSNLDQMVALRQIGDDKMFAGQRALEDALYNLKREALEKELAISGLKLDKVAELNAAIEGLEQQHQLTLTAIDHAAVLERSKDAIAAADAMQSAFSAFLQDLAGRTMTVSQAFAKMANSIVGSLNRIAADAIAKQLFGAGTSGGGWLARLAGMIFPSSGSAGWVSGSDLPTGGYASGTDFARGGLSLVGEHGPEIVNLPRGSQVIPNNAIRGKMGGHTIINHINVMPGASRQTADQAALALAAAMHESLRKYG